MHNHKIGIAVFASLLFPVLSVSASKLESNLNPNAPPSGNFDLTCWNLTLPIGPDGAPTIIPTSALTAGYQSKWFHTNSKDGGMLFWCPVDGSHTKGSKNPRSELRETFANGKLRNWYMSDGPTSLSGELAVTQVPSSGKVVIAQIHDTGSAGAKDNPLIKLIANADKKELYAQVRKFPDKDEQIDYTLATDVGIKNKFSYVINLENSKLSVSVNGNTKTIPVDSSWAEQKLYFKAGDYPQDHEGPSSEGGRVVYYLLNPPVHR
jgi:hypothetical protein